MSGVLEMIAARTAGSIGPEFLAALVKSKQHALEASLVFITVGIGAPPSRARSVACWSEGSAVLPFEYDLEGTACRLVYDGETVVISEGLYRRFQEDKAYEGYLGVPLRSGPGKVFGHFAVLTEKPLTRSAEALAILRLFALRAEVELGRMVHEREREALIASLSGANRRLASRHRALRSSNETKTQLLHMMAHDLRSPLSVILSRAELIGSLICKDVAKASESSAIIVETAERMARLVASAIDQARSEAAAIAIDAQDFPADRAFEAAIALNQVAADRKSIVISRDLAQGVTARGDEDRVIEALDNLIGNAIKYSGHGKPIEATLALDEDAIHFIVRDEGPGLSAHDRARAFRPFERLSAKPTAGETSTGLGLSIVRSIAEAHGGSASVESAGTGKGAAFTLSLPHGGHRAGAHH